jgi:hypothetical protein
MELSGHRAIEPGKIVLVSLPPNPVIINSAIAR